MGLEPEVGPSLDDEYSVNRVDTNGGLVYKIYEIE